MQLILGILLIVMSVFLVIAVLMQNGKSKRLSGSIAGGAETFFGKTKSRSIDAMLSKLTTVVAIVFILVVIVVYVAFGSTDDTDTTNTTDDANKIEGIELVTSTENNLNEGTEPENDSVASDNNLEVETDIITPNEAE